MSSTNPLIVSHSKFSMGLFGAVPEPNNLQAIVLRNSKKNKLLSVTPRTTRGEILFAGYDEQYIIDIAENDIKITVSAPSKNIPYEIDVTLLVSVKITEPESIVIKNITDIAEYIHNGIEPYIQKEVKKYELKDHRELDGALETLFDDSKYGKELMSIAYRVKSVSASLPEKSIHAIEAVLKQEVDESVSEAVATAKIRQKKLDEKVKRVVMGEDKETAVLRDELAASIINLDMASAVFEDVILGKISREEALKRVAGNRRDMLLESLRIADEMKQRGYDAETINSYVSRSVNNSIPGITVSDEENNLALPKEALKSLADDVFIDEPEEEETEAQEDV